jgi:mRNA interferase RelE/StbE
MLERIEKAVAGLADNPRPIGCLKMTGRDLYRIRVGDYRVMYEIHDRTVTIIVVKIAHRREAYR